MSEAMEQFDEEAAYDEELAPLMDRIIEICNRRGIPMVAVFQYAGGPADEDVFFCTTALPVPKNRANAHILNLAKIAAQKVNESTPVALAITETKRPDGTHIKIQRII